MHVRRVAVVLLLAVASPSARADRIKLRGGGEIRGVILPGEPKSDVVLVQTETSTKPLTFAKGAILATVREPGPLNDYLARREAIEPTAQAHYDFGLWCEEQKLSGPAQIEFRKAVDFDPEFGPAHKKLGHVLHGSRWLTYDEQRAAQGLVKYKGRWISRAEKDKLDAAAALAAEQSSWASRIKLLKRKLDDPNPEARATAETQIAAIRDPAAIPGLIRAFSADGDAVRIRLAQLIAAITGSEATSALVDLIVAERDETVRQSMLEELLRRHDPETVSRFTAVLRWKDSDVVGRAAWALAAMKSVESVPYLVEALIQADRKTMMVPVMGQSGGGGGGPISGSFGFAQNLSGGPASIPPSAPQGFSTYASQPVLTGVATAPGVVAFGVGSTPLPIGSNPVQASQPQQVGQMPAKVNVRYQNYAVLRALEMLTGENFGFDQAAWRKWVSTSLHVEPAAPRRVPKR